MPYITETPPVRGFPGLVDPAVLAGLLLVGTVHHDHAGFRRARSLLLKVRPEIVLVEISPYSLAYRTEHQRELRRTLDFNLEAAAAKAGVHPAQARSHPQIAAVRRQLELPFEYRAADAFSRETGAELHAVDDCSFSRRWIATWSELVAAENLAILLTLPRTTTTAFHAYKEARRRIGGQISPTVRGLKWWNPDDEKLWRERERFLAERVVETLEPSRPVKALYLGGWQRLVPGGSFPSLRELLGLDPSRCLLLDRAEYRAGTD